MSGRRFVRSCFTAKSTTFDEWLMTYTEAITSASQRHWARAAPQTKCFAFSLSPRHPCLAGETDHNQTTEASHRTSILQLATRLASLGGGLRYLGDEIRFPVLIINAFQASCVAAENPFEVMGCKKSPVPSLSNAASFVRA